MSVKIRPLEDIKQDVVLLYDYEDKLVGEITHSVQLIDVRIQIKEQGLERYYITYDNLRLEILPNGKMVNGNHPFDEVNVLLHHFLFNTKQNLMILELDKPKSNYCFIRYNHNYGLDYVVIENTPTNEDYMPVFIRGNNRYKILFATGVLAEVVPVIKEPENYDETTPKVQLTFDNGTPIACTFI